jgi:GDSL-like Lipase/Acylhydrolase family
MKPFSKFSKPLIAVAASVFLLSSSIHSQTQAPEKPAEPPLNMLVLGDSIMWGQGLNEQHKAWLKVKQWLNENAHREVREKIVAHSGAVIGSLGNSTVASGANVDGEVSRALPTINEELGVAVQSYADPSQVDLVLINGCINDVDVRNLLNAANSMDDIKRMTIAKCGLPMQKLLGRVTTSFPNAHVIVTGYFPIISEKTPNSLFLKAVALMFYQAGPQSPKPSLGQLRARLVEVSQTWYQTSNATLADDAEKLNAELSARGSRQRVVFVEIPFPPEYSFNAPETRLWGFNASFLRKLLAILTLGRVSLKTNDDRLNQRVAGCNEFYKRTANETAAARDRRERLRMLCRYASLGHPNRKGATIYADGICARLKSLLTEPGWLRNPSAIAQ